MEKVQSSDGTSIAFDRSGEGPPIIFVDGALCYRASGPMRPLAALLAPHFTVFTYDRRGRGDSGDTAPYAVEREVEDIKALITAAGGSAFVYGVSSGAALALEAANRVLAIKKLALYEAPFIVDDSRPALPEDFLARLHERLASGRRGDAVRQFMKAVGVPAIFVALMRFMRLVKARRRRPHAGLRHDHPEGQPERQTVAGRAVVLRHGTHARDGRREEPGVDAPRDAGPGGHPPRRETPHPGRSDTHGVA
jgi:pimeloyl-ACP methyl ester carboxylesterase